MDNMLRTSTSPHIHCGRTTRNIMLDVVIALAPATIAGCVIFGWKALLVIASCVIGCVGFEFLYNLLAKKEQTINDFSAIVTGLLLALNLPATIPVWQCFVGSLFAIVVVKCLFGGLGKNLVNPAITARVFMIIAFGSMAKQSYPVIVDTAASSTPLSQIANGDTPNITDLLLGLHGGSIGETCAVALLVGFVYLLVRKVISWHLPVTLVGTVFVLSLFMEKFNFYNALVLVLSGGLLLGAIFMATDYVTSPATSWGKVIFGVMAGLVTFLIRYFGTYPEGVSFAILLMNIVTPYIDAWTSHKIFGGAKK